MPYISEKDRAKYANIFNFIEEWKKSRLDTNENYIETKGDLEYILFKFLLIYMADRDYRYSTLHDAVYACQHVADEFRRRYLDKREDEAMKSNGDIA